MEGGSQEGTGHSLSNPAPPFPSGVRLKSVVKPFAEWRRGKWRCKTLPFYTIRKRRPPRLLGRLFIVIGFGLFKTSADGM
jgi:hypothetical protein